MAESLNNELMATNFFFKNQTSFFRGKVRDTYVLADKYIVLIACDRISAFDNVLPEAIPYKGQILTEISSIFLEACKDIVPTWMISTPDPNVTVGHKCDVIPIEFVVRNYMCGHLWRLYKSGNRTICGNKLPDGLKENDRLPELIITSTTKNSEGKDHDITLEEILERKLCTKKQLEKIVEVCFALFDRGTNMVGEKGLILVDSKYEFGIHDKKIMLIDEIHTPDSSRFFYTESYKKAQKAGEPQRQLSKEFVREWLIKHNFSGQKGELVPEMTSRFIKSVSERYIEMYETFTETKFEGRDYHDIHKKIETAINEVIEKLEF